MKFFKTYEQFKSNISFYLDKGRQNKLFIMLKDKIIGSLRYSKPVSNIEADIELSYINIYPKYQGNGYSKLLIEELIRLNPDKSIVLLPDPIELTRYYKSLGFKDYTDGWLIYQ